MGRRKRTLMKWASARVGWRCRCKRVLRWWRCSERARLMTARACGRCGGVLHRRRARRRGFGGAASFGAGRVCNGCGSGRECAKQAKARAREHDSSHRTPLLSSKNASRGATQLSACSNRAVAPVPSHGARRNSQCGRRAVLYSMRLAQRRSC